jgi:hypothetical protein
VFTKINRIINNSVLSGIVAALMLWACRKDVTLKLPEYHQKVVVEGSIETGQTALVFLTWSVPYFAEFDYSKPEEALIKGATAVVTDGIVHDTLLEADPRQGFVYIGTKLKGREGQTYTLSVTVNGSTYVTSTTILKPARLDTLFFKVDHDSLGLIWQHFKEPEGSGDCYRWMSKRLNRDIAFAGPFGSVFEDKFVDGKEFDFAYDRGPQPNQIQQYREDPERGFYKKGDVVVVKFCKIGRAEYDFWYTYYQNKASNSNPFSAPTNVKSMFSDFEHVFGAFVGYAPTYDTLRIPKN